MYRKMVSQPYAYWQHQLTNGSSGDLAQIFLAFSRLRQYDTQDAKDQMRGANYEIQSNVNTNS